MEIVALDVAPISYPNSRPPKAGKRNLRFFKHVLGKSTSRAPILYFIVFSPGKSITYFLSKEVSIAQLIKDLLSKIQGWILNMK